MISGGWELLNQWLVEAKEEENKAVLLEVLKVFQNLPVTVDILKKNNSAKTIKSLSKTDDEGE